MISEALKKALKAHVPRPIEKARHESCQSFLRALKRFEREHGWNAFMESLLQDALKYHKEHSLKVRNDICFSYTALFSSNDRMADTDRKEQLSFLRTNARKLYRLLDKYFHEYHSLFSNDEMDGEGMPICQFFIQDVHRLTKGSMKVKATLTVNNHSNNHWSFRFSVYF